MHRAQNIHIYTNVYMHRHIFNDMHTYTEHTHTLTDSSFTIADPAQTRAI